MGDTNDQHTILLDWPRALTEHVVDGKCANLKVECLDKPGEGGAAHTYAVSGFDTRSNPSDPFVRTNGYSSSRTILVFQNGPIDDHSAGANGLQHEALLAIVIDRLRGFQSGPFACPDNAIILTKLEEALMWMQKRTRDRINRGVEGSHTV